jgi:replicative DNA helicase
MSATDPATRGDDHESPRKKDSRARRDPGLLPKEWRLPASLEAERAVLGCMLLSPREAADAAAELLRPEMFHSPAHEVIFAAACALLAESEPLDPLTLRQRLADLGQLERVGGDAYLADVLASVGTAAHIHSYAGTVRTKHILRESLWAATRIEEAVREFPDDAGPVLEEAQSELFKLTEDAGSRETRAVQELILPAITYIEERRQNKGSIVGVPTGFRDFDELTGGLRAGQMVVFAARPGVGKTSFALNVAEHIALGARRKAAFISLEMTNDELMLRLLSARSRVSATTMHRGFTNEADDRRIHAAAADYQAAGERLFLDDSPGLTITQIRTKARRLRRRHGIDILLIDYLQLIQPSRRRNNDNRQAEVAEISSGVKAMAKELGIPVVVLCQLNRESEKRDGSRPRLIDLRESGSIEQDADIVAMVVRPEMGKEAEDGAQSRTEEAWLNVEKHRNGQTGRIKLTFHKAFTMFADAARSEDAAMADDMERDDD